MSTEPDEWQRTAEVPPPTLEWLIACGVRDGRPYMAQLYWDGGAWWRSTGEPFPVPPPFLPTHWRRMPAPPKEAA